MIIAVTNLKGGVGKSTISRNLAVHFAQQGIKTCIVDTDLEQKTSTDWSVRRPESAVYVPVFPMTAIANLTRDIKTHHDNGYEMVIIDGVPQLSAAVTKTIAIADLIIIPIEPSFDDLLSFQKFIDRYNEVKVMRDSGTIPAFIVLNRFSGRNKMDSEAQEALSEFEEHGIKTMQSYFEHRTAYRLLAKLGLTVIDNNLEKDIEKQIVKAKKEVTSFCTEVENIISQV